MRPKPKHTAGTTHRSRCPFKACAGGAACSCGINGKKYFKIPLVYRIAATEALIRGAPGQTVTFDHWEARIQSTARKWAKKRALKEIERIKEDYEGE